MNIYSPLYGFPRDSRIKKSILPNGFIRYNLEQFLISFLFFGL